MTAAIGNKNACQSPFSALGLLFSQYFAAGTRNISIPIAKIREPISSPLMIAFASRLRDLANAVMR